jgi:GPH family glycoside/pentoside/hexuronide:cation symporter
MEQALASGSLSRGTMRWYGAPAFAGAAMGFAIAVHLAKFYSDVVLAPISAIAVGAALARALDALVDPPLGWLSDRARTRWGRRKPFIALGVPVTALAFYLLFAPPVAADPTRAVVWFVVAAAGFPFVRSLVEVAYGALGLELSRDYHERSRLFGTQALFIAGGTLVATFFPEVLAAAVGLDARGKLVTTAAVYALLFVLLNVPLLLWVREPAPRDEPADSPFVPGVRRALRNAPFRVLLLAGILNAIPVSIPAVLMPYYTEYVIQPGNPSLWLAAFVFTFLATGFVCLPAWVRLAHRIGKLATLIVAGSIGTASSVLFFFAGPGDQWWVLGYEVLVGLQSQVGYALVPAMAADVVDYDHLRTGRRREAQFAAFWGLIPKLVAIPSAAVPLAVLGALGYVPNQPQTPEVLFAIRFLFAAFPAVFYVAALVTLSRYQISESVHGAIRAGIDARARGEAVRDPITGAVLPPPGEGTVDDATGWALDYFSRGELRRFLRDGPARLVRDVLATVVVSGAVAAATAVAAGRSMTGLATEPGSAADLVTVLAIVVAGLALTATCLHGMRLRPARVLARRPGARADVEAHLRALA